MIKNKKFITLLLGLLCFLIIFFLISQNDSSAQTKNWYKGQLHVHSLNSFDSTDSVATVVSRYQNAGYDFIAISDHNFTTNASQFNTATFLTIPNNELSLGSGNTVIPGEVTGPRHVNAINISGQQPSGSPTTLQGIINLALSGGALPQINHPVRSGYTASDIINSQGAPLMEVVQAGDTQMNAAFWDSILSQGKVIWATGTDDAHNSGNTNRDWVVVSANSLSVADIVSALQNGDFYASNGPTISSITKTNNTLSVTSNGNKVTFIGQNGTVLQTVNSGTASYTLPTGGLYVRAVVFNSSGKVAYIQPYFPGGTSPPPPPPPPPAGSVACNLLDNTDAVPAGFGASFNVHSTQRELIMHAQCKQLSVDYPVGNGSQTQYIYNQGYYWTGTAWQNYTYACANLVANAWCVGTANYTRNMTAAQQASTNYYLAFVCDWSGTAWQCGCNNSSCTQSFWNLQAFRYP